MASAQEAADRPPQFPKLQLSSLLLGALLAALVLHIAFHGRQDHFEELALGAETRTLFASVGAYPIHCSDADDAASCIAGHRARGGGPVVLWLGNSQLHAINQFKPGQENAPPIVHRRLASRGLDLLAFSQPNANLQEHLVMFTYLRARLPIEILVLPLVFDDLREVGIRAGIAKALADPDVAKRLERYQVGRQILARHRQQGDGDLAALNQTMQQASEAALTGWLTRHSDLWALRAQARGTLFSNLYDLRNTVFGITAQSKRRMIPGRMQQNLAAAQALLREAREAGIAVLTYVVPLRSDVEPPYDEHEYAEFKQRVAQMARSAGATHLDLESLVPASLWGQKDSTRVGGGAELDFMHFQAGGHALLARAVGDALVRISSGEGAT